MCFFDWGNMSKSGSTRTRVGLVLASVVLLGFGSSGAAFAAEKNSVPDDEIVKTQVTTVNVMPMNSTSTDGSSVARAGALCQFQHRVDYVHKSSSPGPYAMQSHGSWKNTTCKSNTAVVTTRMMKRNIFGIYVGVGRDGVETLPSGNGGADNRVTARYECKNQSVHNFKSFTDVDVVAVADLPTRIYSDPVDRACD